MRNEIVNYLTGLFQLLMFEIMDDLTKNYIKSSIQNRFSLNDDEVVIQNTPFGAEVRVYFFDESNTRCVICATLDNTQIKSSFIDSFKFFK